MPRLLSVLSVLAVSCLAVGAAGCGSTSGASERTVEDRNVLTKEQIEQYQNQYTTALDLVRARRPAWLSNRRGEVVVFFNGHRYGGPDSLRDFLLPNLSEMRYVGIEGSFRYASSDHPMVIILVETR